MKTIYDLELHEELILDDLYKTSIIWVPWWRIYTKYCTDWINQVFVPFREKKLTDEENQKATEIWTENIRRYNELGK